MRVPLTYSSLPYRSYKCREEGFLARYTLMLRPKPLQYVGNKTEYKGESLIYTIITEIVTK